MIHKVLEAVREASMSVACLYDWLDGTVGTDLSKYQKDIEHIQNQLTIIEKHLDPFVVAEHEEMKHD